MLSEAELDQIKQIVRETVCEAIGGTVGDLEGGDLRRRDLKYPARQEQYLPTSEAIEALGYTTKLQLYRAIKNGTFRVGKEYQDRSSTKSQYSSYYFNIAACLKRLQTPPEKRGA